MKLVDASVILRFLLNDNPEMAQEAKEVIEAGAYTKPEVIAEVVYVLKGVYQASREDIQAFIKELLQSVHCAESGAVTCAVDVYAATKLDFVDCLLIAYHRVSGADVFTFDRKLARQLAEN